jgi:hypothetical protein
VAIGSCGERYGGKEPSEQNAGQMAATAHLGKDTARTGKGPTPQPPDIRIRRRACRGGALFAQIGAARCSTSPSACLRSEIDYVRS